MPTFLHLFSTSTTRKSWDNLRDRIPFPYSEQDGREWIQTVIDKKPPTNFTIDVAGKAVGSIGIYIKDDVYRLNAELGYWLSEDFWNHGIMTDAVKQMVAYVFSNFEIARIYSSIFEHNLPSMRVLEKAGFHKEAIHPKAIIKNGKIIDDHIYVMLNSPLINQRT